MVDDNKKPEKSDGKRPGKSNDKNQQQSHSKEASSKGKEMSYFESNLSAYSLKDDDTLQGTVLDPSLYSESSTTLYTASLTRTKPPDDAWDASLHMLYRTTQLRRYFIAKLENKDSLVARRMHNSIGSTLQGMSMLSCAAGITPTTILKQSLFVNEYERNVQKFNHGYPFLITLLQCAHSEVNRPENRTNRIPLPSDAKSSDFWNYHLKYVDNSYLAYMVLNQEEIIITYKGCAHQSVKWNTMWVWRLDVHDPLNPTPGAKDLQGLIQEFGNEQLQPNSQCPSCNKWQMCTHRKSLVHSAPLLFIHLKRSDEDVVNRGILIQDDLLVASKMYSLQGAILYHQAGKNALYSTLVRKRDNCWTNFINETNIEKIENQQASDMLARWSYLLLYIMKDTDKTNRSTNQIKTMLSTEDLKKAIESLNSAKESIQQPPKQYEFCGLVNLGLSCYINSTLQALYTSSRMRHYLIDHPNSGLFHATLSQLFVQMQTESTRIESWFIPSVSLKPIQFLDQFRKARPMFGSNEMHDAQEFLTVLLETIHREVNVAKKADLKVNPTEECKTAEQAWNYHVQHIDNSDLCQMLMGQVENRLVCVTCKRVSQSWACFWQLQAQLESEEKTLSSVCMSPDEKITQQDRVIPLKDCLKEYITEENLKEDSAPFCTQCQSPQPATKSHIICRWPLDYLIVHLKRFAYDGTKIHSKVSLDQQLDLSVTGQPQQVFQLSSVVLHRGTESRGHYFTLYREEDNKWVRLDDETITKRLANKDVTDLLNDFAYICIYRAIRNDDKNVENKATPTAVKQGSPSVSEDGARVANNSDNKPI